MITKSDWQNVRQRLMNEGRRDLGDPPTDGEMLAYTRGELSPAEEDRIRELLVHDPELARMAAEPFPTEGAEPGDPDYMSEHEFARHWTSLKGRRAAAAASMVEPKGGRVLQFWRATAVLAAALALVFGGLLWKAQSLLGAPRAGWETVLLPDGQRGPAGDAVTLRAKGAFTSLVAIVGDRPQFESYRVEIVDAAGDALWSQTLQSREEDESLTIVVPRASLKPGRHKVVLYGIDGKRNEQLDSYSVRVPGR